jgi:hypothetical protein
MDQQNPNRSSTTLEGREDDTTFAPLNTHQTTMSRIRRSLSHTHTHSHDGSQKETRDPDLDIDLPYRTLSANANLDEYRVEVPGGAIPGPIQPEEIARKSTNHEPGQERRYKLVTFTPGDKENPKNWSKAYKWWCTMVVALTCFVVAFCSSVITADIAGVVKDLNVSNELALVSISLFVVGFGVGPMVFAPLSEIYGRRII